MSGIWSSQTLNYKLHPLPLYDCTLCKYVLYNIFFPRKEKTFTIIYFKKLHTSPTADNGLWEKAEKLFHRRGCNAQRMKSIRFGC